MVRREGGMGQGFPYLIERFLQSAYCWKGKSYSIRFKDKMLLPVDSVTFISSISSDDRHPQLDSYPKRVTYNQCFGSVIFLRIRIRIRPKNQKRIRILVKIFTHITKNEPNIFLNPLFGKKKWRNVKV